MAINRALELAQKTHQVTLVDLDLVEPCYTLRPLKKRLVSQGIHVLSWETGELKGLGEAGVVLRPGNRWALKHSGDIVLDIGYGVDGARTLNLLEGAETDPDLKVLVVINISRPMTSSIEEIVDYVKQIGRVDGLVNNTHLGDETTIEVVQKGAQVVSQAARRLGLPMVATTILKDLARLNNFKSKMDHPVREIVRYMPEAFW